MLECKGADGADVSHGCAGRDREDAGVRDQGPDVGRTLYPALLQPGAELNWGTIAGPQPFGNALEAVKFVAFKNPEWDWRSFNAATDIEKMDTVGASINTAAPNLKPFFDRGGKLLMYHGWNDQQVPAQSSVSYFNVSSRPSDAARPASRSSFTWCPG